MMFCCFVLWWLLLCVWFFSLGNEANGKAFQEPGGSACILGMVKLQRFRRMALRLLTQLILLEGVYSRCRLSYLDGGVVLAIGSFELVVTKVP